MKERVSPDHPLYQLFFELVCEHCDHLIGPRSSQETRHYLSSLLVEFSHTDAVFAIRSEQGKRIESVFEMLEEGDVRLKANSFERERQVHKHVGDFVLFWSAVSPSFLERLSKAATHTMLGVGQESYRIVSSFDHSPFDAEAPLFRNLSEDYSEYALALARVSEDAHIRVA